MMFVLMFLLLLVFRSCSLLMIVRWSRRNSFLLLIFRSVAGTKMMFFFRLLRSQPSIFQNPLFHHTSQLRGWDSRKRVLFLNVQSALRNRLLNGAQARRAKILRHSSSGPLRFGLPHPCLWNTAVFHFASFSSSAFERTNHISTSLPPNHSRSLFGLSKTSLNLFCAPLVLVTPLLFLGDSFCIITRLFESLQHGPPLLATKLARSLLCFTQTLLDIVHKRASAIPRLLFHLLCQRAHNWGSLFHSSVCPLSRPLKRIQHGTAGLASNFSRRLFGLLYARLKLCSFCESLSLISSSFASFFCLLQSCQYSATRATTKLPRAVLGLAQALAQ